METLHKHNDKRGILPRGVHLLWCVTLVLLAINAGLLYGIFFSSEGIPGYHQQRTHIKDLEAKVRALQKENSRLFEKIQNLKSDPLAQEKLVRQHLGWTRPNELVIEFPSPEAEPPR